MQQVAAEDRHQLGVLAVPGVDQAVDRVHHQRVQVVVVAAGRGTYAQFVHAGAGAIGQDARRGIGAVLLQPADIHVLEQGIGDGVRGGRAAGAVEADHDAVQRLAPDDGVAEQGLEFRLVRPRIQLGVGDVGIEVGLRAVVAVAVGVGRILGGAVRGGRVGGAGNRAGHAQADLLALLLGHADHVDAAQELAGFLDMAFQGLLHGGIDGELLGHVGHAVDRGQLRQHGGVELAGFVAHCAVSGWCGAWVVGRACRLSSRSGCRRWCRWPDRAERAAPGWCPGAG